MMKKVFSKPESLTKTPFSYCPGCHKGIFHRLIAEVIDELQIRERTIGVCPVGCMVLAYKFFNIDMPIASHGRAPEVAAGIKDVLPDRIVFTLQGDGDLAGIGLLEIIDVASRGENITVIFDNNAIYGMTGGQMAPTTLIGQKTTTTSSGRDPKITGYPLRVCELLATLEGVTYLSRVALITPRHIIEAKKAIKKAFQVQLEGKGFSLVEILSACPQGWKVSPSSALKKRKEEKTTKEWLEEKMIPYFPLGEFKVSKEGETK
jgi:2-oxoglutarate ferredoxin oxidoreductase subunit beta